MRRLILAALLVSGLALATELPRTPAPEGAVAYIISPAHGETVTSPFRVVFGLQNMGVAPAGVDMPATGHHHLIIDAELPAPGQPIPSDDRHIHFGKGQTETTLELPLGEHTLQLVLGDARHVPHDPPVTSRRITVIVK